MEDPFKGANTKDADPFIGYVDGEARLFLMIPKDAPTPTLKTGVNEITGQRWVKAALPDGHGGWRLIGMTTY